VVKIQIKNQNDRRDIWGLEILEVFDNDEPPTACRTDTSNSSRVSISSLPAASLNDGGEDVANESR
jgi:hypothetical protein